MNCWLVFVKNNFIRTRRFQFFSNNDFEDAKMENLSIVGIRRDSNGSILPLYISSYFHYEM